MLQTNLTFPPLWKTIQNSPSPGTDSVKEIQGITKNVEYCETCELRKRDRSSRLAANSKRFSPINIRAHRHSQAKHGSCLTRSGLAELK